MPALLGLLLCAAGLLAIPGKAFAQIPRGVFSLSNSDRIANEIVLNNPDVTGVCIRHSWASLEPAEGVFDWTFLDSEVARAAAAGKQVMLRIGTQASKPNWVTTAIRNAGGTFFVAIGRFFENQHILSLAGSGRAHYSFYLCFRHTAGHLVVIV